MNGGSTEGQPAKLGDRKTRLAEARLGSDWPRRLLLAAAIGCVVFLVLGTMRDTHLRLFSAWNATLNAILVGTWIPILRSNPEATRAMAAQADLGGVGLLAVSVLASIVSLLGAILVIARPEGGTATLLNGIELAGAILAIATGWLLMQTGFALHYAQLYWGGDEPGGLNFPGEPPDDVDFAYFAFGIGMTFQVADVTTTRSSIRRSILVHATLSFVYNSTILALTINLLAGRF